MKRLLFLLLLTTCSVSRAEWEVASVTKYFTTFIDKSTKRKKGNFVEMWELKNYSEVMLDSVDKYWSVKVLRRYDCLKETQGVISMIEYSELFGDGKPVWSGTRTKNEIVDEPNVPGSVGETSWKIACDKK